MYGGQISNKQVLDGRLQRQVMGFKPVYDFVERDDVW